MKSNVKTVVAFILGIVVAGGTVYAATLAASSVTFNKTNVTQYGATKDNVQDAIAELYGKANDLSQYKEFLMDNFGGLPGTPTSFATDSWATIAYAVKTGNTSVYAPTPSNVANPVLREVDLGTLGTHYLRVANTTPCTTETSKSGCGFVIEFADVITEMNFHSSKSANYGASDIQSYVNTFVYNKMPQELQKLIIPITLTYVRQSATLSLENQKVYLLSLTEVIGTNTYDKAADTTRQLDYYYYGGSRVKECTSQYWWSRSQYNSNLANTSVIGSSSSPYPGVNTSTYGVSPAFRIG